ncbi:MAG TPA: MerR family transcriptional regulator [Acidimicrobiales bacterium]|nr:MerR family transcriptional regulator [Acidimicrobiales bacterium]
MTPERKTELLGSGEFGRRSQLSPKALRIYSTNGLLRPVLIEPSNGYRRYGVDQLATARLITMLRGVDMSLSEIALVLEELDADPLRAIERVDAHSKVIENRHVSRRILLRYLTALIRKDKSPMFTINTRHVPARRFLSIQRRLRAFETDGFVHEAKAAFAEHLAASAPTGPFTLIFHGVVSNESDGPIEATVACPNDTEASDLIGVRTEEAHDEAFTTITKAQWDYPAILAAYDAVACSPEALARPNGRLSCREVYLAEPESLTDDELICDIAFPLGDADVGT